MTTSPVLRGATTATTGGAPAGTLPVPLPAGTAAGDILMIWCAAGASLTGWTVPGFTVVPVASTSSISNQLLWRVADGTEGASVTATASASNLFVAICGGYHGGNTGNPFDPPPVIGQANAPSATITVAGVTTSLPADVLVWFGCVSYGPGAGVDAIAAPAAYTPEVTQVTTYSTSGTNVSALMADYTWAGYGPTGNQNGGGLSAARANGGQLVSVASITPPNPQVIVPNRWPVRRAAYY